MAYTRYAKHLNALHQAMRTIRRDYRKFREFDHISATPPDIGEAGDWSPWLRPVSASPSAFGHDVRQYNRAIEAYFNNKNQIDTLQRNGDICISVADHSNKHRYIMDVDTQRLYQQEMNRRQDVQLSGYFNLQGTVTQADKNIVLRSHNTDGVRIQCNDAEVNKVRITDTSSTKRGHRDAFQIIPAMQHNGLAIEPAAGALTRNIRIDQCTVEAPTSALQGFFMSDGLCRDVSITNNYVRTSGSHFITINGALTGCRIINNVLQQAPGGEMPRIKLDSARLGGNIADDGNLYVLSFAWWNGYYYDHVEMYNNYFFDEHDRWLPEQIIDHRGRMPSETSAKINSVFLNYCDFDNFLDQYTLWTLEDFRQYDPVGFLRLRSWLAQRIEEYRNRYRIDQSNIQWGKTVLKAPTREQQEQILPILEASFAWLERMVFENNLSTMRLAALRADNGQNLAPLRSFIIKRLAMNNAEIQPLSDLNSIEFERRDAQLKWYLAEYLPVDSEDPFAPFSQGRAVTP